MEPITLCGLVIVIIGLWVEFESPVRTLLKMICKSKLFTEVTSYSELQRPVYGRRMPICEVRTNRISEVHY